MTRALLIGKEPMAELGCTYVGAEPYDAVVIGSLELGQLLRFREPAVLTALAEGKPVYLYTPGLPEAPKNRALAGVKRFPGGMPAGTEKLGRNFYRRRTKAPHYC